VARGVDEGDRLAVVDDLVGADVLCDAAGLAGDDIGVADGVEQRGLAVVDMAHDGHDRGDGFARRAAGGLLLFAAGGRRFGGDGFLSGR